MKLENDQGNVRGNNWELLPMPERKPWVGLVPLVLTMTGMDFTLELKEIYARLKRYVETASSAELVDPLTALEDAANDVGRAWSGSPCTSP